MARHSVRGFRTRAGLAALLVLPLALGACGGAKGGSATGSSSDTLRVLDYYNSDPNATLWKNAIEACGKTVGMKISREAVPGDTLIQKVLQQASSKTLPDVLMLDNPDVQQIAASGALAPLDDLGIDSSGVADGVLKASTYEGKLYGLQPVTNTIALFYNKKILDAAGVTPPTTWDELKADAAKLTTGDQYGFAMSNINTYEGTWQFLPFMWSNGGDEKDIDTPQTAAALQLVKDMLDAKSLSQSSVNWSQADVADQFTAGKAAMMINGPWNFGTLDKAEGLEYGIVPIPVPQAGGKTVSPFGGEAWTVPQTGDKDKQKKAAELVQCLNSDENEVNISLGTGTVPTKPALADQVTSKNPNLKAFADQVPDLRARTGELGPDWPKAATKIYTAVQNALVGGMTPEDALKQAQNG
ncbi:sugar ABC transporter substrate-binding protein [Kineococcus rhizosphaerae]|uniref:Carbohydrate ABC transporter substrate-binding protein (CUT1 family) n=1 Tax=Kineococcus rhizosphaerae TaxID=559628 RepID=A0A2T0R2A6_9ACTN|nr:ABC transporter substrate-binding protein [Kineococcus rhizosphaerae]PRY13910.1 carbohydrate ABC transporter substrate-binding protein (CUT1 family) [Kineococcus rhizosphaerae]